MPIIQSCCCWRSLRRGCYASALYTMVYFAVTIVTMGHFIEVEQRFLNGGIDEPESESFLEPGKITPITVSLNITLLACSTLGLLACILLMFGVYKDIKYMLLPWVVAMGLETLVEIINVVYLFYLQTLNFNPITSFLFTLDFFIIVLNALEPFIDVSAQRLSDQVRVIQRNNLLDQSALDRLRLESLRICAASSSVQDRPASQSPALTPVLLTRVDPVPDDVDSINTNIYAMVCVISQFQEYLEGRGTAAFDYSDRLAAVQYTATAQHTTTTSSMPSGRRRSAGKPMPSRHDPEEFSEAPSKAITSVLSKPSRSGVKKHVQFPDEQSCIEEATEAPPHSEAENKPEARVISSLWMELESEAPTPER